MDNLLKEKDWLTINDILLEMYDIEDILVYPQQILRIFRVLIPYTKGYFLVFDTRGNIDEQKSAFLEMSIKECETYVRTFYEKDYIKYTFDLSKHTITYRGTDIIEEEYRKKTEFYQMFLEPNEIPYGAGIVLRRHGKNIGIVNFFRNEDLGDFQDKDMFILSVLKSHVAHILSRLLEQPRMTGKEERTYITEAAGRFGLSYREQEVLEKIDEGLSNAQIADQMGISISTVKKHVYHIFEKAGVNTRGQLRKVLNDLDP